MESSPYPATPSLFLLSNELELNELLCDLSSPHPPNRVFSNTSLSALEDQGLHNDIDCWDCSTASTSNNSTSANRGVTSSKPAGAGVAKRDWLSSLPQSSTPAVRVSFSPSLHELICRTTSSSSHSSAKLRHSISAHNLQTCGRIIGSQHRSGKEACIGTKVADNAGVLLSQSMHVAANGGKGGGPKPSSIALRLSDIMAALRPKQPIVSHQVSTSHMPNPTSLTPIASPTTPLINPASKLAPNFNTSTQILADADKILQESCKQAMLTVRSSRGGTKRSKKASKAEKPCSNKGLDDEGTLKCSMQNRKKRGLELGQVTDPATKREVHIFSERERRRGMTHLYGTLRSLLPEGKVKKVQPDRCSVLTETMKYIEALLEQLEELGRQKTEALAYVGGKATIQPSFVDAMDAEMHYADSRVTVSMLRELKLATSTDQMNMTMKIAIAAALSSYYSSVEANAEDLQQASVSESDKDGVESDDGIVAEVDNADDMDALEGERRCVSVRFFGEDVFITVRTMRTKGMWSGLLELLQKLGINVFNVTLAASPDSDHHGIHAKIPIDCKLGSSELRGCLKTFVNTMTKGSSPASSTDRTMDE